MELLVELVIIWLLKFKILIKDIVLELMFGLLDVSCKLFIIRFALLCGKLAFDGNSEDEIS